MVGCMYAGGISATEIAVWLEFIVHIKLRLISGVEFHSFGAERSKLMTFN